MNGNLWTLTQFLCKKVSLFGFYCIHTDENFVAFSLCQEKRNNREETRLQQTLENNREVSEKLIPASIDTMETNLPQLREKCKSLKLVFVIVTMVTYPSFFIWNLTTLTLKIIK